MLILSQDGEELVDTKTGLVQIWLLKREILSNLTEEVVLGTYETEQEAKAAFEDLIEQLDEIEGVVRLK